MTQDERTYILERFYNAWKINLYVLDKEKSIVEMYSSENFVWKEKDGMLKREAMPEETGRLLEHIYESCRKEKTPLIFQEQEGIYFMGFFDDEDHLFVLGPAAADDISFMQQASYRKRHMILNQKFKIPKVSLGKALNGLALLYYMITGRQTTEDDIFSKSNYFFDDIQNLKVDEETIMIYEIEKTTEEQRRLAYRDELQWLSEIENGTRRETRKMVDADNLKKLERIGTFSNKNALKQYEYMVVASTTLACRAAIRGGMNTYDAYHLADIFFQKASLCTDVIQLLQLYTEVADEYSSQVRKAKEKRSSDLVDQCKEYIARHRTKKFSLIELANAIGNNPSYLSRIFSEQTHKTLQEYALEKRLEAGVNLLKYSDRNVGEIAEYLNFPSQSYFGEKFKKVYGLSPAEYRKTYKVHDFKNK